MKRRSISKRVATAGLEADGLDTRTWSALYRSVSAAFAGDASGHIDPLINWEREAPSDTRAALYLWYLIRLRLTTSLGRRPTRQDIADVCDVHAAKFSLLILDGRRRLNDTLLTICELAEPESKVSGGDAVVFGAAALGVLLDDPARELEEMRPRLAAWWQQNKEGLGYPDSPAG